MLLNDVVVALTQCTLQWSPSMMPSNMETLQAQWPPWGTPMPCCLTWKRVPPSTTKTRCSRPKLRKWPIPGRGYEMCISHNVKVAIFLIRWSCHCKSPKLCVRCRSGRTWKQNGTSMRSCSPRLRFRAMSTKLTVSSVRIWIYSLIIRLIISNPSCHPSLLLQCLIPWLQWIKHYTVAMRTSSTRCFRRQCWVCSPSSQRTKDGTSNSWRQTEKLRSR